MNLVPFLSTERPYGGWEPEVSTLRSREPEDASYSNTNESPTVQNSPHGDWSSSELLKIKDNKYKGLKSEREKKYQAENLQH